MFRRTLLLAAVLRIGLIVYGVYHDAHSALKYTDIDYNVFTDGAWFILEATHDNRASGPLVRWLGLTAIGDPYTRETYRYTPLLAFALTPNLLLHSTFGKVLFASCDIIIGVLLYRILVNPSNLRYTTPLNTRSATLWVGGLWLLNPIVANISTRGSAESILGLFVVLTLLCVIRGRLTLAAAIFGLAVHFKIYPFIYGISVLMFLEDEDAKSPLLIRRVFSRRRIRFTAISLLSFLTLNVAMYAIWGYPYLEHAWIYHLTRRDHRHNFSAYFYPIYLTYNRTLSSESTRILENPLLSFAPQLVASIGAGIAFGRDDLAFAWFVQTVIFVLFNKVCTAQYFLWYMWFLPLVLPQFNTPKLHWVLLPAAWVGLQALWLLFGFKLEFLGEQVFRSLWLSSIIFLVGNTSILVYCLRMYQKERL